MKKLRIKVKKQARNLQVVDGKDAVMGRLASYVAKELLKGDEVAVVNVQDIIISGNRQNIREEFEAQRRRVGTAQRGPKVSRNAEKIVKRVIRGMLPEHRWGRGREAIKRVKCYIGVPPEFEKHKKIEVGKKELLKGYKLQEFAK